MILGAAVGALILILARWATELWLSRINELHVRAYDERIPEAFHGIIDENSYRKSVNYTLARNHFSKWADTFDTLLVADCALRRNPPVAVSRDDGAIR